MRQLSSLDKLANKPVKTPKPKKQIVESDNEDSAPKYNSNNSKNTKNTKNKKTQRKPELYVKGKA